MNRLGCLLIVLTLLAACEKKEEGAPAGMAPAADTTTQRAEAEVTAADESAAEQSGISAETQDAESQLAQAETMAEQAMPEARQEVAVKQETAVEKSETQVVADKSASKKQSAEAALSTEEALALAKASGCLMCHHVEKKLIGPAWQDVAKRYKGEAGAAARLVTKVKEGGKGNWTEETGGVAMPPYSPRVSDENIGKLVSFILSL